MSEIIRKKVLDSRLSGVVIHNHVAYLSGQVSWNAQSQPVADQAKDIFATIDELLAEAGTSKENLLFATVWLTDMNDFDAFNDEWYKWIPEGKPPARACIGAPLAQLKNHEFCVEIAVTAAV